MSTGTRTLVALGLVASWIGGCTHDTHPPLTDTSSDSGLPPTPQGGTGGTPVVTPGTIVDGGMCNTISLDTNTAVMQQALAEAPPVPIGGMIADGTYFLTRDTIYTGPGGATSTTGVGTTEVQIFSGQTINVASQSNAALSTLNLFSGVFATSAVANEAGTTTGSTLTFAYTCPVGITGAQFSYSVAGTQILEFVSPTEVLAYTMQ